MVKVLLQKTNLLLLDEPTNHLDIDSKEILLCALQQFDGTILFVSHDRDFLNKLATRVIELTSSGIASYAGNYDDFLYQKEEREKLVLQEEDGSSRKKTKQFSGKEGFAMKKRIRNLESKIEKLEVEKKDLQLKLESEPENLQEIYDELLKYEKELEKCFVEWEVLQSRVV